MNKGISLSKGKWLLFLGCDDKLYSNEILDAIFSEPFDRSTKLIIGKIKFDWQKKDSFFVKKNDGVVSPFWSKRIWIKNTLPHQGVFYNESVFDNMSYSLNFAILADYALNLNLFKAQVKIKVIDNIISVCGTNGISKNYSWKLYREEINLKTAESSILLKPLFIINAGIKFVIKRLKL